MSTDLATDLGILTYQPQGGCIRVLQDPGIHRNSAAGIQHYTYGIIAFYRAHCQLWIIGDHGSRSEEHTSELQSRFELVCRLLLEKKKQRLHWTIKGETD